MALTEPSLRRLKPVRLTDIPLEVRCQAAQREAKLVATIEERQELLAAALTPSNTTYWIQAA